MYTYRLPMARHGAWIITTALVLAVGCGDSGSGETDSGTDTEGTDSGGSDVVVPETYEFNSRFEDGSSSVSYSGQAFRQVLISSLKGEMAAIQDEIDMGAVFTSGEVAARLNFYYQFDSASGGTLNHGISTTPAPLQTTWDDISTDKDLQGKIAGNDEAGQHKDWTKEMVGWDGAGSPDALIQQWFNEVDALAVEFSNGNIPLDPDGGQITKYYISPEGLDYTQLIQKFLLGAINYSQGADDYLDNDLEGKGLMSDNTEAVEGKGYTALEHAWDEGFGYWGGAINYLEYSDDEIATADGRPEYSPGYNDYNGDGAIDLISEINYSASVNAGKRDRGSADSAPTDFSTTTMTAFLTGRAIIAAADGALSDEQMADLVEQRDIALDGWERALAATAVHYVNDTIKDMNASDYNFADHAKHWGELKGFLLALQFSPHSQVSDADLATAHSLVGTAPVLPGTGAEADYINDLIAARDILGSSYGFDAANLGDANGENGW